MGLYETDPAKLEDISTLRGGLKGLFRASAGGVGNAARVVGRGISEALMTGSNADKPFAAHYERTAQAAETPFAEAPAAKITPQAATAVAGSRVSANQTVPNGFRPVANGDPNRKAYPSYQYFNPKTGTYANEANDPFDPSKKNIQYANYGGTGIDEEYLARHGGGLRGSRSNGSIPILPNVPEANFNPTAPAKNMFGFNSSLNQGQAEPSTTGGWRQVGETAPVYEGTGLRAMTEGERSRTATMGPAANPLGMSVNGWNDFIRKNPQFAKTAGDYEIQRNQIIAGRDKEYTDAMNTLNNTTETAKHWGQQDTLSREELYKYKIPNMEMDSADRRAAISASTGLGYANLNLGYKKLAQDNRLEGIRMNNETKMKIAEMKGSDGGNKLLEKVIAANAGDPMALSSAIENISHIQKGEVYTPPKKGGLFGFGKKEAYWSPPGMKPTGKMTPDGKQIYTGANGKQYIE